MYEVRHIVTSDCLDFEHMLWHDVRERVKSRKGSDLQRGCAGSAPASTDD